MNVHLVQRAERLGGAKAPQTPPCCSKCNSPPINWPLMMGNVCTFGIARRELGEAEARPGPSSLYQMKQPTYQRPVYQSPYCCIMVRCFAVLMCPQRVKNLGNRDQNLGHLLQRRTGYVYSDL